MTEVKQPKTFLKKGTRQYLSNATVRSLNQKPKVVDFGEGQEQFEVRPTITNPVRNESQEIKVEIKVNNKPKPKKEVEAKNTKQNKHSNQDKNNSDNLPQNKKKSTALDDYIVTKNSKNDNSFKERPVPPRVSLHNQPKISMVGALKRQEQHLSDDNQDEIQPKVQEKKSFKPPTFSISGNKPHHLSSISNKKVINIDLEEHAEKIHFNSDSEQQAPSKAKPSKPQVFPKPVEKKNRWDDDQPQQKAVPDEPKGPSKILQKFYKKQPEAPASKPHNGQKKLTVADIPIQLKLQIFQELLAQKQSSLTKKLQELQSSIDKANKDRQAMKEAGKQLTKERTQFQQEMQRRKKQFQQKLSAQNSKLNREKKYLKEHQTSGKVDWRVKNEVQQLKGKLEQSQVERKKMKTAHIQEMQRIKKKLQEQQAQNEMLKGQIRCIQVQKLQLKSKTKQAQKKNIIQPSNDVNKYWHDAPTHSYVSNFFQDNFTLISLDPQHYSFQNLQYYVYYCQKKDQVSELVSQQHDQNGDKIIRRYKNGKEQIQYVGKVIKEIFPNPFKFTVVHHQNGDVKMVLQQGITVYYDRKNQITEWKINPDKVIYSFHKLAQIQMKFRHRRLGEIQQCYKNNQMKRTQNGQIVTYHRNDKGQILPGSRNY